MKTSLNNSGVILVILIMMIMGLGLVGGYFSINFKAVRDEEASKFTVEKMKRIANAISSSNFNPSDTSLRHFEDDVGKLPSSLTDLTTQGGNPACTISTASGKLSGWCGPYWTNQFSAESIDKDGWGQNMTLATASRSLRSRGPNLQDDSGGSDDLIQIY